LDRGAWKALSAAVSSASKRLPMHRSGQEKPAATITVRILTNHPIVALYLAQILRSDPRIRSSLQAGLSQQKGALPQHPHVCLVDSTALPLPLAAYLRSIRTALPEAKILVLGTGGSQEELFRLLFLGIDGFIPYREIDSRLISGVRAVWEGRLWVSRVVLERFAKYASHVSEMNTGKHKGFSSRECEIIEMLKRRLANKEIAAALGVKERTIRFHLDNIFSKLGVHDRYSAVESLGTTAPNEWFLERDAKGSPGSRGPVLGYRPLSLKAG